MTRANLTVATLAAIFVFGGLPSTAANEFISRDTGLVIDHHSREVSSG
jgi:hypothetical protein